MSPERNKVHYVAVYAHPDQDSRQHLLQRVVVDLPLGLIPPPTLSLHKPLVGPQEFTCCGQGTQAEIARLYGVAQQTVGRWVAYTEAHDLAGTP